MQLEGKVFKGQLISKGSFGIFKSIKKNKDFFARIIALASKKCLYFFDSTFFGRFEDTISKLTDL
jgi:hypothetical protein